MVTRTRPGNAPSPPHVGQRVEARKITPKCTDVDKTKQNLTFKFSWGSKKFHIFLSETPIPDTHALIDNTGIGDRNNFNSN